MASLKTAGVLKTFSKNIGEVTGFTSSQVRKDFSTYGITGNKRAGYSVMEIIEKIDQIFGRTSRREVVLAGYGKLGAALIDYRGFGLDNIKIKAAFDIDPSKFRDGEVPVYPLDEMKSYIVRSGITAGIITVPAEAAGNVYGIMVNAGIRGILNFAPIRLKEKGDCYINNVNLANELENVMYFCNNTVNDENL